MDHPSERYGCTRELWDELRGHHEKIEKTPIGKYNSHKSGAAKRGLPFTLTLAEWWKIWDESGHWAERGKGRARYCMARKFDRGGYTPGNVEIQTNAENMATSIWCKNIRRVRTVRGPRFEGPDPDEWTDARSLYG